MSVKEKQYNQFVKLRNCLLKSSTKEELYNILNIIESKIYKKQLSKSQYYALQSFYKIGLSIMDNINITKVYVYNMDLVVISS